MDTGNNSMTKVSGEVEQLMKEYIGSGKPASPSLQQHLKLLNTESKFSVVCSARGASVNWTGVAMAAFICDIDGLEAMLNGFTEDQQCTILKIGDDDGDTPLHCAVYDRDNYHTEYTIKDVLVYLLNDISHHKVFDLLKTQNKSGDTMLHCAAFYKEMEALQVIFSTLSSQETEVLLSVRNCKGVSVGDLSVQALIATAQDLKATKELLHYLHDHSYDQTLELAATKSQLEAMMADELVLRSWSEHNIQALCAELNSTNRRLKLINKITSQRLSINEKRIQESQTVANRKQSSLLANGKIMKTLQDENYKLQREKHELAEERQLIYQALIELDRKSDETIKELEKEREQQAIAIAQMNHKIKQLEAYLSSSSIKEQMSLPEQRFYNADQRGSCLTIPKSLIFMNKQSSAGAEHRSLIRSDHKSSKRSNPKNCSTGHHKCASAHEHSSSSTEEHTPSCNNMAEYKSSSMSENKRTRRKTHRNTT